MTYFELWKWGEKRLADAGIAEASLDARYLLLEAFEMDMAHFLLKEQEQVPATEGRTREYSDAIQARAAREAVSTARSISAPRPMGKAYRSIR